MSLPHTVPKSALDRYVPIKRISRSENNFILACIRKNVVTPTPSSLLALKVPSSEGDREALLGQLESLRDVDTRRVSKVIDYDPRGNWYITPFVHGHHVQHLKETLFQDGFPPFLVCKIFVEVMAMQSDQLEPKGICHADLRPSNIIISPSMKEVLPYVTVVHLEGIAIWNEPAIVRQTIGLLRYLTDSETCMPARFRTIKRGERLENIIEDTESNSLADGDAFYSFIAGYHLEGEKSWKALKSEWVNMASALAWELLDMGRLADVEELIGDKKVTTEELREAVEEGGMDVIDDRDL